MFEIWFVGWLLWCLGIGALIAHVGTDDEGTVPAAIVLTVFGAAWFLLLPIAIGAFLVVMAKRAKKPNRPRSE